MLWKTPIKTKQNEQNLRFNHCRPKFELSFELYRFRQDHGIIEHFLGKIIQFPLVPLRHFKIIAGDFKPQGKVDDSLWVTIESNSHSIFRCSLAFPEGKVTLEPNFVCMWFLPVCTAAYPTSPLSGAVLSHCDLSSCR